MNIALELTKKNIYKYILVIASVTKNIIKNTFNVMNI
jgi:hypothetical protein